MTYTLPTNVTTMYDLLIWGSEVTDYLLVSSFLVAFTFIIFITFIASRHSAPRAAVPALFIGAIASTLFNIVGMVGGPLVITYWVLLALSALWLIFER